jgi:glycosyltransferase involved in cell wall biosynthesis
MGGTEYYVKALSQESLALGIESIIAAPASKALTYKADGIDIYRFPAVDGVDIAYGAEDIEATIAFEKILDHVRPDIVHQHAYSSAISYRLMAAARQAGARTVFTYHTPTVSCFRGTMMAFGKTPCDGRLVGQTCTACNLEGHGVSPWLAKMGSMVPVEVGHLLSELGLKGGPWLGMRMRALIEDGHTRFSMMMADADHVVAVCDWVGNVLKQNGIQDDKLSIVRQGLIQITGSVKARSAKPETRGPLKLAFFGRLDATKGVDTLIKACRLRPDLDLNLTIFGICQPGAEDFVASLHDLASGDRRIQFEAPVQGQDVVSKMAEFDCVCVPSVWLETGPLVVYEAFGAGVPVLGSRLGGIAELVRDQTDGLLIEPGNPSAWAHTFDMVVNEDGLISRLADNIRPPRTMLDVAQEMDLIYQALGTKSRKIA